MSRRASTNLPFYRHCYDAILRDFRLALRGLRKHRGFALTAILTLALGIGASTLIFSAIDCVLLRPYPYRNADRLATFTVFSAGQFRAWRYPVAAYFDFKEQNHVFEAMVGLVYHEVRFPGPGGTDEFFGGWVTPDTFDFLGIRPLIGRAITSEDAKPGAPPVFVMSYRLWSKRFNRDPKVLGSIQILNATPMTLVGIMPPRFRFGDCEVWLPIALTRNSVLPGPGIEPNEVWPVGRLRLGVSRLAAAADLEIIGSRLEKVFPIYFPSGFKMESNTFGPDAVERDFKITLFSLMAAVTMLLLIACSNVANLFLARATAREKEIALRASLGATRGQLIRQLFVETFSISLASCGFGCLFAYLGLQAAIAVIPPDTIPSEAVITLSPSALLFSVCATLLTTLICGLAPAVFSLRNPQLGLLSAGKGTSSDFRRGKLRAFLVVAEVALSIILLVGSGLMMRTLFALKDVSLGFDPSKVLYARLSMPEGRYNSAEQKKILFRKALGRIQQIPGVLHVAETSSSPPYTFGWIAVSVFGQAPPANRNTAVILCTEGYFDTLQRSLLRGRLFSATDVDAARHAVVVNETFARQHFGAADPLNHKVRFPDFETLADWPHDPYFEIVGVVADAKNSGLQDPPKPEIYLPATITGDGPRGVIVRTTLRANVILEVVRASISSIDPDIALADAETIESLLRRSYLSAPRFLFVMLGATAAIGLLLVAGGVFSVMAYTVSLQTHELGVRTALGAQQSDLIWFILSKGSVLIAAGTLLGLLGGAALTRLLASQVWGVAVNDPATFGAVAMIVLAVGVAACFLPARRASRVDPLVSLRYE